MKYITGMHALNLPCSLDTTGDWHTSSMNWNVLEMKESDGSIFGTYGIERNSNVPNQPGEHYVANTLRALLDLMETGKFGYAQGARNDYICNDKYHTEFFDKVMHLIGKVQHWDDIDNFMCEEFMMEWINYREGRIMPWKKQHTEVMTDFLKFVNSQSSDYVLKGNAAVSLCYGHTRFSEGIELDGVDSEFFEETLSNYCAYNPYRYEVVSKSRSKQKYHLFYHGEIPIEIEVDYRFNQTHEQDTEEINEIRVYNVNRLAIISLLSFLDKGELRDLADLIYLEFWCHDQLSETTITLYRDVFGQLGMEYIEYLLQNNKEDIDALFLDFNVKALWDRLGLVRDQDEETEDFELKWDSLSI